MADAHVTIGGIDVRVDLKAPEVLGRSPFRHWTRSPFTGRSDITGRPGSQNFYPDLLRLELTDFVGEGQVVLRGSDPDSAKRFYQSEGLNMRVPGQFSLNRSAVVQAPQADTSSASTTEGSDMTAESGTITDTGTDTRLNSTTTVAETGNHAPGAVAVEANFHLYKEAQQLTSINGSSLVEVKDPTFVSGSTLRMRKDSVARTANLSLTAAIPHEVQFFLHTSFSHYPYGWGATVFIRDVTADPDDTVASKDVKITNTSAPSAASVTLTFTPKAGRSYRAFIRSVPPSSVRLASTDYLAVNTVQYGQSDEPTTVTLTAWNETDSTTAATKTVQLSSTTSAMVASLTYNGTAAKNYRYKVTYDSGRQRPLVDKISAYVGAAAQFTFDAMHLGQGGNVWVAGSRSATDAQLWFYDFTDEHWDAGPALNASTTSGESIISLAHTDQFEYALTSGGDILRATTAADTTHTAAISNAVAIAVAQDRLFVLTEDATAGTIVYTYPLDSGAPATSLASVTIGTAKPTLDQSYRQRMVGTPTGARFFTNYSDVHTVIYEVDSSGTVLTSRQVAILDPGAKATAIAYSNGVTFVGGQFLAETGETPLSALWVIEQNGVPRRIGEFRDGNPNAPIAMQPYQNDLWVLQGNRVWRYSLSTGGVFLEYQHNPTTQANAKGLAIVRGHQFALYSDEGVFTAGSESTYRQASVANGNSYTSSTYDFDLPGIDKELDSLTILTDEMPSATAIQVEMQTNQSGTWTVLGSSTQGSKHTFRATSTELNPIFQTIQVRVTCTSQTGANTPTVKGVVVLAWTAEEEEFFDLVLRTDHEDSSDHVSGSQRSATTIARQLWAIKQSRRPVEFTEHFDGLSYLVRVEEVDDQRDVGDTAEGRAIVRLRVLR